MMQSFEHYLPTRIKFGKGKLKELPNFLPKDLKRILIVTGRHSSKENGSLTLLETLLKKSNKKYFLFDEVEPNPSTKTVNNGALVAREERVDAVIGLGGGSSMDAAKCIARLARNDGPIEDYMEDNPPQKASPPIIGIPTTAGTGSEVTQYAVITDSKNSKKGYSSPYFFPSIAILDPEFTLSLSHEITINTGIDALTHAIEGYLSIRATPISDNLALEAIQVIREWLPRVTMKGNDIDSRTHMLYASMIAGIVIAQTKTIMLHAMSYPLTTFCNIPHGKANGILLPQVLKFLQDVEKGSTIIKIFGGKDLGAINSFINQFGISTHLSDYGITLDDIPKFTQDVWGRINLKVTPKEVKQEDIANIYKQAL